MKGIPNGLHTDVDVRVRSQLLSDEACRGKPVLYDLARDVAILPSGCLLWASRAGSVCPAVFQWLNVDATVWK